MTRANRSSAAHRRWARLRKGLVVGSSGMLALLFVIGLEMLNPGFLERLSNIVFDNYQRLAPRTSAGAPTAIVDIDEASINKIGQWPWPRTTIARMVDTLGQMGAATVAFDMVFPEPDRTSPSRAVAVLSAEGAKINLPAGVELDNDAALAAAITRNRVVLGIAISNATKRPLPAPKAGFAFGGANPKSYLPGFSGGVTNLPVLTKPATGMGFFSFPPSADGIIRSMPLVASSQSRLYPALSAEALRVAQGAGTYVVRSTGASGETDTGRPAMTALKDGALSMPTGPDGQFLIYYSGLPNVPVIPADELLDPTKSAAVQNSVAGRIVLVGTSAVGLRDLVATPMEQSMPGVRVHAEIIDQIIGQTFLSRPDWAPGLELTAAVVLGLILLMLESFTGVRASTLGALLFILTTVWGSWWAFTSRHLLLDPILPVFGVGLVFAVTTPVLLLWTDRDRRFIRGAFGRYLSPELVRRLTDDHEALTLGGEVRDITVLFTDIRGFTSLSENLAADELTSLLNGYLTPATEVLLRFEATIDKYIGDAIMAFWNAPVEIEGHQRKACLGALSLLDVVDELNRQKDLGLRIGIGLNSGECCVGNLGSAQRFSYSAIGDTVNVASRVESLTKQYHVPILVTEGTRVQAGDLAFLEADRVRVVGRLEPVPIHALVGDAEHARSPEFLDLLRVHESFLAHYRALEFDAARERIGTLRKIAPPETQGLYDLYSERMDAMRHDPPAQDWDGVFTASRK